jgi:hypothetical protein
MDCMNYQSLNASQMLFQKWRQSQPQDVSGSSATNSWHVEYNVAGDLSADPEYLTHGAKMTCFRAVGFSIL